jgi:RNA polymerase sigma factor (sigma-70 family)
MAKTAATQRAGRAGSVAALAEQIYAAHRARLLAIARRNCSSTEEAEEALQDAFAIFIDRFNVACDAPPLAWLTTTLKRRCWAIYRRQRQIGQLSVQLGPAAETVTGHDILADPSQRPDGLAEDAERLADMRSRLTELKPQERQALGLLAFGYSYREICELTGWTYTKVNRCVAEGRARLRELGE